MNRMSDSSSLARDLAKGAIAGAVATLVMSRVTSYLMQQQDPADRKQERKARRGRTAYGTAAERAVEVVGVSLDPEQRERLATAVHWGLGVGLGALYGVLRTRMPGPEWLHAVGAGTTFWGLVDEGMSPALGLNPPPGDLPLESHGRMLAGHLTYGMVTDGTLRLLDRVL